MMMYLTFIFQNVLNLQSVAIAPIFEINPNDGSNVYFIEIHSSSI